MRFSLLALLMVPSLALGDIKADQLETWKHVLDYGDKDKDVKPPRVLITTTAIKIDPKHDELPGGGMTSVQRPVVAISTDGKSAWFAAEIAPMAICGEGDCSKVHSNPDGHVTALFDGGQPVVLHTGNLIKDKELAKAVAEGSRPTPIARSISGAEEAVKQFEATMGDPEALAKTVSNRADVVLFGNDLGDRVVGGASVRSTLQKWKLGLKLRDGILAGVTSSKAVAWVVANVDARGPKKTDVATPYRLQLIYEKTGTSWQLVQLHFSF